MGKPSPQDKVNQSNDTLMKSDTKLQVAGSLRLAAGYFLPPQLKVALSLLTGFEAGKRYHDYREHKETLNEAQTVNPKLKDPYPGFFHLPTSSKIADASNDIQSDVTEAYDMVSETLEQIKNSLD